MADSDTEFEELLACIRARAEMQVTPPVAPVESLSFHATPLDDPNLDPSLSSLGPRSRDEFEEGTDLQDVDIQINMEGNSVLHEPLFTAQRGREMKRQRTLTTKSDMEAKKFLQMLQMSDIIELVANDLTGKYCLPDTVKKTAQDYASAAILMPNIQAYKALGLVAAVITVMCNLGVQDLPPQHETGRCTILESVIAKALTDMRCYMKAQIGSSIANQKENCNDITILTNSSIGTTKAQSTLALRMRLAFLQEMYIKSRARTNSNVDFWKFVDEQLVKMQAKFPTSSGLIGAFQDYYEQDLEKYGVPNTIENPIVTAKAVDSWLNTLDTTCGKVVSTGGDAKSARKSRNRR